MARGPHTQHLSNNRDRAPNREREAAWTRKPEREHPEHETQRHAKAGERTHQAGHPDKPRKIPITSTVDPRLSTAVRRRSTPPRRRCRAGTIGLFCTSEDDDTDTWSLSTR